MAKLHRAGNAATVVMYITAKKLQKFAQHVIIHRLTSKEELKTTKISNTKSHELLLVGFFRDIIYLRMAIFGGGLP